MLCKSNLIADEEGPSSNSPTKILADLISTLDPIRPKATPLTGRQVMVPITTMAFFAGTLDPQREPLVVARKDEVTRTGEGRSISLRCEEAEMNAVDKLKREVVMMNLGSGYYTEMNRKNACDMLGRRLDNAIIIAAPRTDAAINGDAHDSATRKSHTPTQVERNGGNATASIDDERKEEGISKTHLPHHEHEEIMPYFEIREEYDSLGNEIKAEAINISAELQNFDSTLRSSSNENGHRPDGKPGNSSKHSGERLLARRSSCDNDVSAPKNQSSQNLGSSDSSFSERKRFEVSQSRYIEISSRLDDLALIEAKCENEKSANAVSAKRIKGKGWRSGFLLKSSAKGKKDADAKGNYGIQIVNAQPKEKDRGLLESAYEYDLRKHQHETTRIDFTVSDKRKDEVVNDDDQCEIINDRGMSNRKVRFSGEDDVKSIALENSSSCREFRNSEIKQIPTSLPTPTDQTLFTGSVVERGDRINGCLLSDQTASAGSDSTIRRPSDRSGKRMSRFAQQRQQQRDIT